MGACCSNQNTDGNLDVPHGDLSRKIDNLSMKDVALIIKIQAHIRGFLTRKKIRAYQYTAGIGSHQFYNQDGNIYQNYDNEKVKEIRFELGDFDFDNGQTPQ